MNRFGLSALLLWLNAWQWRARLWTTNGVKTLAVLDGWMALAGRVFGHTAPHQPQMLHAMATRAHVLAGLGQWASAERQLQVLIAHQPLLAAHWFNLGYVRGRMGCPEAAQSAFEHALVIGPTLDAAWFGLGLALSEQGCWQRAEAAWLRQVALQPWCPDGLEQLIRLHHRRGDRDRAAQRLAELRQFDPRRAMALEALAGDAATATA